MTREGLKGTRFWLLLMLGMAVRKKLERTMIVEREPDLIQRMTFSRSK